MRVLRLYLALSLTALWAVSCTPARPPGTDAGDEISLAQGGFVPRVELADLRGTSSLAIEDESLWLPLPVIPLAGWGPPGRGWHPVGNVASLRFWRRAAGGSALLIDLMHRGELQPGPFRVSLRLNGETLGSLATTPGRSQQKLPLPPGLLQDVNDLVMELDPQPSLVDGPAPLTLLRVGPIGGGVGQDRSPGSSRFAWTEAGSALVGRSGAFVLPVDVPADSERIAWRLRNRAATPAALRLFALRASGERVDLWSGPVTGRDWQHGETALAALAGQSVTFAWELDLAGAAGEVELTGVRFDGDDSAGGATGASTERPAPEVLPDVVLIILDAARGDRFPGWDYPRQTMPRIEALGREALSFRYAFAECPTTSCSIPAMITSVPFLPGGQVGKGSQLSDELTTLAEYLGEKGYRTYGLSATPNNSASHNLDQGFSVFRELWGRGNPDHGPFAMARIAAEAIRSQPADQPLFLQLHFLPPHQPYDPGPEFDRFTDPDYAGPIRPDMSLARYSLGLESLTGADLEHLVGLYDGNLGLADAVVGRVLAALEDAGRFDRSLLIITSDHGEAFMEHGRQGHNTSLFDEMLHVPLMIRLPGGQMPTTFEPDRLASLLDVVPTVLGQIGIRPRPEVGGVDLLHSTPVPGRQRTLFFRSSHPRNLMLAARTPSWKMIAWPSQQVQLLFDLTRDPGELDNLVGERPLIYAGLGLRTRQHLASRPAAGLEGEAVEMTEEAEEALKALGYLN